MGYSPWGPKELDMTEQLQAAIKDLILFFLFILFASHSAKSQPTGEDPDAGKDWRRKEKGATEDEMIRQPHRLNEHEFEQIPGESRG